MKEQPMKQRANTKGSMDVNLNFNHLCKSLMFEA